ncbi:MAG: glycosyltransferase family 2 protein [Candidatus Omnitrophica bacterium]|nr:glycosyltransferase family 2 protein [Candidatus Omnitrophota bacterium]
MKCDIIIPVWNQLSFTKDCIDSIRKNTPGEYGLIVIDNASGEETVNYLEGLKASGELPLRLIRNSENLGFVRAVNQGMTASEAPFLCLLNNDTIVTKDWLKEMIAVADSSADIGIVNPSSNNLGQKPADGEPVDLYAEKIRRLSGRSVELGAAIGFCMLIKRELIRKIGLFDEIYGMGNFEDTDFSRKAVKEGYRCVRACGAYVYHRESSSFGKVKTFDEDFNRNKEIFEFRWGKPKRIAYILDLYDVNILKRLEMDSIKLARDGNWVWFFAKDEVKMPVHSNITMVTADKNNFYMNTAFKILTKKKRFSEIFVGGQKFWKFLDALSFIHKAKVRYY